MNLSTFKQKSGFTLIELLTVISIIAILTALLSVSFISVSQRSRDGQRKSNIRQIQAALELYRSDNDAYPSTAIWNGLSCNGQFLPSPGTRYMSRLPCDPVGTNVIKYYYNSVTPFNTYTLGACLDNASDKERTAQSGMPACTSGTYFVVNNP